MIPSVKLFSANRKKEQSRRDTFSFIIIYNVHKFIFIQLLWRLHVKQESNDRKFYFIFQSEPNPISRIHANVLRLTFSVYKWQTIFNVITLCILVD